MSIDFDPSLSPILKFVEEKAKKITDIKTKLRLIEQEEEKRLAREEAKRVAAEREKRAAAAERAEREAEERAAAAARVPGMSEVYKDPVLVAGLQNPRVMGELQQLMSRRGDPDALGRAMADPEVS